MTELTRRSFLQGLMALAGVAAVGLPPTTEAEAVAATEQLATEAAIDGDGSWGRVRLGDVWYPLDSAELTMQYPAESLVGSDLILRPYLGPAKIEIALTLGGDLSQLYKGQAYEVEIDSRDLRNFPIRVTADCTLEDRDGAHVTLATWDGINIYQYQDRL